VTFALREDLSQHSAAGSAPVPAWPNGALLSFVGSAAPLALPNIFSKSLRLFGKRVVDRDSQEPTPIHLSHLHEKVRSMVRSSLEHVELPLVNHLMRERAQGFLLDVMASLRQSLEQWE